MSNPNNNQIDNPNRQDNPINTRQWEKVRFNMSNEPARRPIQTKIPQQKRSGLSWLKKPKVFAPFAAVLIIVITAAAVGIVKNGKNRPEPDNPAKIIVSTIIADPNQKIESELKAVGVVKPNSQIDVAALAKGTVKTINFWQGSYVSEGAVLAELYNESIEQSLNTALTGLKSAQDDLDNVKALQEKNQTDVKNNAVISASGYLNTINSELDQINFIIKADGDAQLPNIGPVLSIKDGSALVIAKNNYSIARQTYSNLSVLTITEQNVIEALEQIVENLRQTQTAVDNTISVLDNTGTSFDFSASMLTAQKSAFSAVRSAIINVKTTAETQLQNLENISLLNKRETDALTSALELAQAQVSLAQISHGNLMIKAPISGRITEKYIEIGQEINPGQGIAQISQTYTVKVETNLPSQDIYFIRSGQTVSLNNNLYGTISSIHSTADPVTKKVKVEISAPNSSGQLIPETFVDISIPAQTIQKTKPDSILIPLRALNMSQNESYVFIVQSANGASADTIAKKRIVTVGPIFGALVEILTGIEQGDEVIIDGSKYIEDNGEVEAQN